MPFYLFADREKSWDWFLQEDWNQSPFSLSTLRRGGKTPEAAIALWRNFDFAGAHVFIDYGMSYAGNRGRQS